MIFVLSVAKKWMAALGDSEDGHKKHKEPLSFGYVAIAPMGAREGLP
jgi:hypothetical protein